MNISAIGITIGNYIKESILGVRSRLGGFILWMGRSLGVRVAPHIDPMGPRPDLPDSQIERLPTFDEIAAAARKISGPMAAPELEATGRHFDGIGA